MVQASFCRTAESAGALDGWSPKELSLPSLAVYCHIATLHGQIEEGAPMAENHHACEGGLSGKSWSTNWEGNELQTAHDHLTSLPVLGNHET